jgi:hypothetical protein
VTRKSWIFVSLVAFSSLAYASGAATSIGTVSARGDLRVDGYSVWGNTTLFNGSAIQTGQATATLRLNSGTEITLATNSHGQIYGDHLVLLQGKGQLKASGSSFFLEADGLRVSPNEPNALGVVTLNQAKTVDVAAVAGDFRIVKTSDLSLAHVASGAAMRFQVADQAAPAPGQSSITGSEGLVSEENGGYYFTDSSNQKYELVSGKDLRHFAGKKVVVSGFLQASPSTTGLTQILVTSIDINGPGGSSGSKKILVGSLIAGGAAGVAVAIAAIPKGPASP